MPFAITTCFRRLLMTAAVCLTPLVVVNRASLADEPEAMQSGDTLFILGDNTANSVTIVGAKDTVGEVAVYIHEDPWIYEGVEHIQIDLAGGDNELRLARIRIAGNLTVVAGDGANLVRLGGWKDYGTSFIQGDVSITTGSGEDDFQLDDNWVGGSVTLQTGDGSDQISVGGPLGYAVLGSINTLGNSIQGDLTFSTSTGNDYIWMIRSSVLGHTQISTGLGKDTVYLGFDPDVPSSRDQRKGRATTTNTLLGLTIDSGNDDDYVGLKGNDLYMQTTIGTGSGSDHLHLRDTNRFNGALDAHGGNGQDSLINDPANYYFVPPVFNGFEL